MLRSEFQQVLQKWCQEDYDGAEKLQELKDDTEFLERELYHEYAVTADGNHGDFGERLARWIGSAETNEDQKTLYTILRHLFFIGEKELKSSYRTAYSKHVQSWLMSIHGIDPFHVEAAGSLRSEIRKTRFTEITDSFGIRSFLTTNNIQTERERYRWWGNCTNWSCEIFKQNTLKRGTNDHRTNIVLFEDFVGSGSQMSTIVNLACSLGNDYNILLCPLFICPVGANLARDLEVRHNNLTFSPVLEFDTKYFLHPEAQINEHSDFEKIRRCIVRVHNKLVRNPQRISPFGFQNTGGMIVAASNCPNNSIPVLHRRRENSWEPLFLRNSR